MFDFLTDLHGPHVPALGKLIASLTVTLSFFALSQVGRYIVSQDGKKFIEKTIASIEKAKKEKEEEEFEFEDDVDSSEKEINTVLDIPEEELSEDPLENEEENDFVINEEIVTIPDLIEEEENNNENKENERSTDDDKDNC